MRELILEEGARETLGQAACTASPREACGLLVGRREATGLRVEEASVARNLAPEANRFLVDPVDHMQAELGARARGLEVVGVWHSHPNGSARPSRQDREAAWPGWSYVIVALDGGEVSELRSWHINPGGALIEERVGRTQRAK